MIKGEKFGQSRKPTEAEKRQKLFFATWSQTPKFYENMKGLKMFLLTREARAAEVEGFLMTKRGRIYIYRVENNHEIKLFKDGVIVENLAELWEIVEEIKNRIRVREQ